MALKHRNLGIHTMQKSQLKRRPKSLVALKNNSHIGIWILILCKSRIVILHRLVTYYGVCYYLEERSKALAALGRWSVGHARQAQRWVSGVQGAERSASSTEPCCQWGSPFASPNPGDGPRQVTGGAVGDAMRRHGVFLLLQAGCHGTAVDQFGGGTEKAPAFSLVTHCQALDAQGESQADELIRQGFNLICTVYTFE